MQAKNQRMDIYTKESDTERYVCKESLSTQIYDKCTFNLMDMFGMVVLNYIPTANV